MTVEALLTAGSEHGNFSDILQATVEVIVL